MDIRYDVQVCYEEDNKSEANRLKRVLKEEGNLIGAYPLDKHFWKSRMLSSDLTVFMISSSRNLEYLTRMEFANDNNLDVILLSAYYGGDTLLGHRILPFDTKTKQKALTMILSKLDEIEDNRFDMPGVIRDSITLSSYGESYLYSGELLEGIPFGTGVLINKNIRYEGEWFGEALSGIGVVYSDDKLLYEGTWVNLEYNGIGILRTPLYTHVGNFCQGDKHGPGRMDYLDGGHYAGQWNNGKAIGYANVKGKDGTHYRGQTSGGKENGYGKKYFPNGTRYIGGFKEGKLHGYGTMTLKEGESYSGLWEDGKKSDFPYERYGDQTNLEKIEDIRNSNDSIIDLLDKLSKDKTE